MKIVFASTPNQEEQIKKFVRHLYRNVFPIYFSDDEIEEFQEIRVLETSIQYFKDINTLYDAFQVMTSLQTIISILEMGDLDEEYAALFNVNAAQLQKLGLFFPFEFHQFVKAKNVKTSIFSTFTQAANQLLI